MAHEGVSRPFEAVLEACVLAVLAADAHNASLASELGGSSPSARLTPRDVLIEMLRVEVNGMALRPPGTCALDDLFGYAVYPTLSFANHSCRPNTTLRCADENCAPPFPSPSPVG
jgi:hypothetical protein